MNKNKQIKIFSLLTSILLIFLCGCPYESIVPLSDISKTIVDSDLIGKWRFAENGETGSGTLTVYQYNEKELLFLIQEDGKNYVDPMKGFVTRIGNSKFLNLHDLKKPIKKRRWVFTNYKIKKGKLHIRIVDDKIFKRKIDSSKKLFNFFKSNLNNKDLYNGNKPIILKRVNE